MVWNLGIFIFSRKFAIRQIWGCWSQIWEYCFQIPAHKYPNKAFLVAHLGIFIIWQNFAIRQTRRCWFQTRQYYFQLPVPKYQNQVFLVPNLGIFILHQTLHLNKFEGVDFKYDNGFFEFQPKNAQIKHFLSWMYFSFLHEIPLKKKWSFPLRISSVYVHQIRQKLRTWSHLLKKSLMENFIFV